MQSIRNAIVRSGEVERYQCSLCFEVDHKVVRLACPCRKLLCLPCMKIKYCCSICEEAVEVEPAEKIPFQFACLSGSPQCSTFPSEKALLSHCTRECPHMPEPLRRELLQALNYQCVKGHRLEIANSYSGCTVCGVGRCKSRCSTCLREQREQETASSLPRTGEQKAGYCIHCRPIPCTTRKCPHNHDLVRVMSKSATCDICDVSVRRYPLPVYSDRACDFDICSNCYKGLEEDHHLLPFAQPSAREGQDYFEQ